MADNNVNPAFVIWHAGAHAGEGPFPNGHEKLFTEAIEMLEGQITARNRGLGIMQDKVRMANARALRYRRQRDILIAVIAWNIVAAYRKERQKQEAARVNPRGM